mgnify:CR=1 FL=1
MNFINVLFVLPRSVLGGKLCYHLNIKENRVRISLLDPENNCVVSDSIIFQFLLEIWKQEITRIVQTTKYIITGIYDYHRKWQRNFDIRLTTLKKFWMSYDDFKTIIKFEKQNKKRSKTKYEIIKFIKYHFSNIGTAENNKKQCYIWIILLK